MPALVILCFSFLIAGKALAYDAGAGFHEAARLLNEGRLLESAGAYDEAARLADDPEDRARARVLFGNLMALYLNDPEGAVTAYDEVLSLLPKSPWAPEALFNKGLALYQGGRFSQAAGVFREYGRAHPGGARAMSAEVWLEESLDRARAKAPEPPARPASQAGPMRVLIVEGADRVRVASDSGFSARDPFGGKTVFTGREAAFSKVSGGLGAGGASLGLDRVEIIPENGMLNVGGRAYRGKFTVFVDLDHGLSVLNTIDVESYLASVVGSEMSPSWPAEALKAQAVAARSYALYLKEKRKDEPYDLKATVASQVYKGVDAETPSTVRAVRETMGQVMTSKGQLVIAYFHANSGGYTEDSDHVWSAALPYLAAVPDQPSTRAPGTAWQCEISSREAGKALARGGIEVGRVLEITPRGSWPSGRAETVDVVGDKGRVTLKSNRFRMKMGPGRIKSARFTVKKTPGGFLFSGTGFGHGVGLSQWGAYYLARGGRTYREILDHYYRGVSVGTLAH